MTGAIPLEMDEAAPLGASSATLVEDVATAQAFIETGKEGEGSCCGVPPAAERAGGLEMSPDPYGAARLERKRSRNAETRAAPKLAPKQSRLATQDGTAEETSVAEAGAWHGKEAVSDRPANGSEELGSAEAAGSRVNVIATVSDASLTSVGRPVRPMATPRCRAAAFLASSANSGATSDEDWMWTEDVHLVELDESRELTSGWHDALERDGPVNVTTAVEATRVRHSKSPDAKATRLLFSAGSSTLTMASTVSSPRLSCRPGVDSNPRLVSGFDVPKVR